MTVERQDIAPLNPGPQAPAAEPTPALETVPTDLSAQPQLQQDVTQQQPVSPEPEFAFELTSGTKYRTQEDLVRGATEKDFTIERLQRQIAEMQAGSFSQQQQFTPQSQPSAPQAQVVDEALVNDLVSQIRRHPDFAGANEAEIRQEAVIQAIAGQAIMKRTQEMFTTQTREAQWNTFVQATPDLQTPLAQHIYENARLSGRPFTDPQTHLDAVHAEMWRRGIPQSQTGGGTTAIAGAVQAAQQRQQAFSGVPGMSPAPQGAPMSPYVQTALQHAQQRGVTDPGQLQRIKEIAETSDPTKAAQGRAFA